MASNETQVSKYIGAIVRHVKNRRPTHMEMFWLTQIRQRISYIEFSNRFILFYFAILMKIFSKAVELYCIRMTENQHSLFVIITW